MKRMFMFYKRAKQFILIITSFQSYNFNINYQSRSFQPNLPLSLIFLLFVYFPSERCLGLGKMDLSQSSYKLVLEHINQRQLMDDIVIAGITSFREGLNYVVPTEWWNNFHSMNKEITLISNIKIPSLNLQASLDTFLLHYRSQLVESIQQKCLYLNFHHVRINLQISRQVDWTPINPQLWAAINVKLKEKNGVLTFVDRDRKINIKNCTQIQLIFCSKTRSQLFVGHVPKQANLISLIREIGFEMGFVEVTKTKLTFMQKSSEVSYPLHQLEKYTVGNAPDSFIMIFNLERREIQHQNFPLQANMSFGPFASNQNTLNQSNQAVVGDQNTMQDESRNHLNEAVLNRTISTGAETPFSFALTEGFDLDQEYRVNELFGSKQPQQIQQMRIQANKKIHNNQELISIPLSSEQKHKTYLQTLAEQILQGITKRKSIKQKEIQLNYQ